MKLSKEVRIGALALVALVLGYIGLNFLKGISLFKPTSMYYADFKNLNNISVSTPVFIRGFKVGSVREIDFGYHGTEGYGATLKLSLEPSVQLPVGSVARIKPNPLSGPEVIITTPEKPTSQFIDPGSKLTVEENDSDLFSLATNKIIPTTTQLLPVITSMLNRVNDLVGSHAIDSTFLTLKQTSIQLNSLVAHLNTAAMGMPEAMKNIKSFSSSMASVGDELTKVKLEGMMSNLEQTTSSLKAMSQQLTRKDNTAGLLLNDARLYNRLDSLTKSMESLMNDIKENPKKYVHISVF